MATIPKPIPLPEGQKVKGVNGMSLSQLMSSTQRHWGNRMGGAYGVTLKELKKTVNKNDHLVLFANVESETQSGKYYHSWIVFLESSRPSYTKRCLVQCSCQDYKFTMEYANAAHSAARIYYGNGEPPDNRNPGLQPGMCKHLVALTKEVFKK